MLYTDCLVHHPISFFTSPDVHLAQSNKRPQLSSIKTLRLGHSSSPVEPPYRDLMHQEDATGAAWGMGGSSRYPHDIMRSPQQELNKLVVDGRYLFSIADWLQPTSERGEDMLPSVERIVLMGRVDDATSSRAIRVLSKGLADVLIRNPSVKHFCQSSILGPLAMSGALYKPLHTPTPDLKPLTLEVRQALAKRLDARIGPWKGRVVFRNADEIPLCPACQIPDTIRVGFE